MKKSCLLIEVILMLMMMLSGIKSAAALASPSGFALCFTECFLPCIIDFDGDQPVVDRKEVIPCLGKCTKKCILKNNNPAAAAAAAVTSVSPQQYYCSIGCAILNCSNPADAQKTDLCTDNCSKNICKVSG